MEKGVIYCKIGNHFLQIIIKKGKEKTMKKMEQLYEGKAKKVFATDDPDVVIVD